MLVMTNFIAVVDSFLLDLALGCPCVCLLFRRIPAGKCMGSEDRGQAELGAKKREKVKQEENEEDERNEENEETERTKNEDE